MGWAAASRFAHDDTAAAEFDVVRMRPNASSGANSGGGFGVGLIGSIYGVSVNIGDLGRLLLAEISLLSGPGDVMGATDHRLHPAQPRIARRADLRAGEVYRWNVDVLACRLCEAEVCRPPIGPALFRLNTVTSTK